MKMSLPGVCPASFYKGAEYFELGSLKVFLSCCRGLRLCWVSAWVGGGLLWVGWGLSVLYVVYVVA